MSHVVLGSASPLTTHALLPGLGGHDVAVVATLELLLAQVSREPADVVVLVHTTGRLDGLAALGALSAQAFARPVVVCGADPAARAAFLAAGAAAFLVRPAPEAVRDAVARLIGAGV